MVIPLLVSFFLSWNLNAQVDLVWDDYGLGFYLPEGAWSTQNDESTFTAKSDNLGLKIQPLSDPILTEKLLAEAVVAQTKALHYSGLTEAENLNLSDLYGFAVEGTKAGGQALIIVLMDSSSATNYVAVIPFSKGHREEAIRLARSFYPYE